MVEHRFGVDEYLAFMTEFDEETAVRRAGRRRPAEFLADLRRRVAALTPEQLTLRLPIVFAIGRR